MSDNHHARVDVAQEKATVKNPAARVDPSSPSTTDFVLGLQRMAGNAATTRWITANRGNGLPITVQRMTLTDAKLTGGLTGPEAKRRRVVGDVAAGGQLPGLIYAVPNLGAHADKEAALKAIAQRAGDIGQRLHDWGKPGGTAGVATGVGSKDKRKWAAQKMFTRVEDQLDKAQVPTMDPFFIRVSANYGSTPGQPLELIYQHAAAFQGYVESISDPGNTAATPAATMFHGSDLADPHGNRRPVYADLHAPTGTTNLLSMTDQANEKGLDAYTKLAGEGARWQCVRDNMSRLANDSIFYCVDPKVSGKVLGTKFDELWVNWAAKFEKRYNIPNSDVIDRLRKGRIGKQMDKSVVEGQTKHINLEA